MSELKGNYPYAVLHSFKEGGMAAAVPMARKLSKDEMNNREAVQYVSACVRTQGQPHLLDLFEQEK